MIHRHLLPNEIDLIVDGEVGFGVAPLLAHVRDCADCQRELDDASEVAMLLEKLPRFAPSHGLADRVMSHVPVFVPWHVAARDTLDSWVPAARPLRLVVLAGGSAIAAVLTISVLWLATQVDVVTFASAAAGDQLRGVAVAGGRDLIGTLFGDQVFVAMAQGGLTGTTGLAIAGAGFVGAAALGLLGLRSLAAANSTRP